MEQLKALYAPAQVWFAALSGRERRLVSITFGAVVLFILFLLFTSFASSARGYERRTADKLEKLQEIQLLASSFREAEMTRQAAERNLRGSSVQLISFLEEKGNAAGIDIPTMNPKGDLPVGDGTIIESAVELTLTDVSISKLLSFLGTVEAGPGVVKVKYLRIEPRPSNETLTAWMNIATYRMK